MKKQIVFGMLLAFTLANIAIAQNKGYITLTQSATSGPALYEGAMAKLKQAGVWDIGWTFHAIGAQQPTGLFSIGIFPDKAALDTRIMRNNEVFSANNLSVPAPDSYEIFNLVNVMPSTKPANAVILFHDVKGMTPEKYETILKELGKVNALGGPAQLFHVAFTTPDGLKVVDIWESPEALQKFAGSLIPILTQVFGAAPPQPAVYGLYNYVNK